MLLTEVEALTPTSLLATLFLEMVLSEDPESDKPSPLPVTLFSVIQLSVELKR